MGHFSRSSQYLAKRRARRARRKLIFSALSVLALVLVLVFGALVLFQWGPAAPEVADAPGASGDVTPTPTAPPDVAEATIAPALTPNPGGDPAAPLPTAQADRAPGAPQRLFDAQRFSYAHGFYVPQIQALLEDQPGPLKTTRFQVGDRSHTFAEVVVNHSNLYSFNPRILLTLLEQQSALLSTAQPAPDQLAWAMGFRGDNERHRGL